MEIEKQEYRLNMWFSAQEKSAILTLIFISGESIVAIGCPPIGGHGMVYQGTKGCDALIGIVIGTVSGVAQFLLLSVFTSAVSRGAINNRAVFFAAIQFLVPVIVLVSCAQIQQISLLWTGVSMAVALIICAGTHFFFAFKSQKK